MKVKKWLSMVLALTAVTACAGSFSACETANPEVKIQIIFQEETYEIEYKLYRKVAPATVDHFLTLAENGYYNGLCVHDYADLRMYTGGYSYDAQTTTDGGLVYKKYYDIVKSYNLQKTVFIDSERQIPTYTLYGEFGANKFTVENGKKNEEYGSLSMYYTDKTEGEANVYLTHEEAGNSNGRDYKYNSTTSLFFISLNQSASITDKYCTFATLLDDDSLEELQTLDEAITAYVNGNDDATNSVSVKIDEDDYFFKQHGRTDTYNVLSSPIIIKEISVEKY